MTSEQSRGEPAEGAGRAPPDEPFETAALWYVRLREPMPDRAAAAARRADFERWLESDPRHGAAYAECRRLWDALEAPMAELASMPPPSSAGGAARRVPEGAARHPARRLVRPAPLAAGLGAAATLVLLWNLQSGVLLPRQGDHRTALGERRAIDLSDGSRLVLNTESAVALDLDGAVRRVRLPAGEAWFDVAPADDERAFVVGTPSGEVRVGGTSFGVKLDEGSATVSLTEGRVTLSAAGRAPGEGESRELTLNPGERARLTASGISTREAFDAAAATAWLRGQLVFFDTPLASVVDELDRYRPGRIVIVGDALRDLEVSGVFRADDPEAALEAILATLPIRAVRLTRYLVVLL